MAGGIRPQLWKCNRLRTAYIITPVGANAVTLPWSFYDGGLNFNGAIPIAGATGAYHIPSLSYYHSLRLFGRSANITGLLPYGVGSFQGSVLGTQQQIYRSGLFDVDLRFSVDLKGGPAMSAPEFAKWHQKALLGASLKVVASTAQYDPSRLINWGIHRWAFKPELGYSWRRGKWLLDGYGGVWFCTTNSTFYSLPTPSLKPKSLSVHSRGTGVTTSRHTCGLRWTGICGLAAPPA
jgi:hypothetical protein